MRHAEAKLILILLGQILIVALAQQRIVLAQTKRASGENTNPAAAPQNTPMPLPSGKSSQLLPPPRFHFEMTELMGLPTLINAAQQQPALFILSDEPPPPISTKGPINTAQNPMPPANPANLPPIVFPSGIPSSTGGGRTEKRLTLNGVFTLNYSRTSGHATVTGDNIGDGALGQANELGVGLDLNVGTYLIDPRFLKFSLGTSFFWDKGAYDLFGTRQTNKAITLYTDFLPTSPYPLRFHYLKQNSHLLERQIASAAAGRDSFGFDWSLRKRRLPALTMSFDKTNYDTRFLASSEFKSKARTFNVTIADNYFGWDTNASYSNQAAIEGVTNLETTSDQVRFDARRQIGKRSSLYFGLTTESFDFLSVNTHIKQQFSFAAFHTDFSSELTDKLTARASYQFYYNTNTDGSAGVVGPPSGSSIAPLRSRTSFNSFRGELRYQLRPEITVGGTLSERFFNSPDGSFETPTRYTDLSGSVTWNRKVGAVNTRASYTQGWSSVNSNFGNSRRVEFHSYSAGVSVGSMKRALITADFNGSRRPDIFQLGGFFSERFYEVGVESQALRGFHIRASLGANQLNYLTSNGRENFNHTSFSLTVDKKPITFAFNRNGKKGVRDIFVVPVLLDHTFVVLPVANLIRDPLLNTSGQSTTALMRLNLKKNLDIEVRYLRDNLLFVRTNDVFIKQLDILTSYRIGKITVMGGAIFYRQTIEGLFSRDRNYYFVRISRPFNLF